MATAAVPLFWNKVVVLVQAKTGLNLLIFWYLTGHYKSVAFDIKAIHPLNNTMISEAVRPQVSQLHWKN